MLRYFIDPRPGGTDGKKIDKGIQNRFIALCNNQDVAVDSIFHPAGNPKFPRFLNGEMPETYALNLSVYFYFKLNHIN